MLFALASTAWVGALQAPERARKCVGALAATAPVAKDGKLDDRIVCSQCKRSLDAENDFNCCGWLHCPICGTSVSFDGDCCQHIVAWSSMVEGAGLLVDSGPVSGLDSLMTFEVDFNDPPESVKGAFRGLWVDLDGSYEGWGEMLNDFLEQPAVDSTLASPIVSQMFERIRDVAGVVLLEHSEGALCAFAPDDKVCKCVDLVVRDVMSAIEKGLRSASGRPALR